MPKQKNHDLGPSGVPLYRQVMAQLVEALSMRQWHPGEMLPSEPVLAARYGVGISTIRAALAELAASNLVVRKQGKGTFVALHSDRESIDRFFHITCNDGKRILPVSKLLSLKKGVSDAVTANQLNLPHGAPRAAVYRIRNVLMVDQRPAVVSDIVVPADLFPNLSKSMLEDGSRTLYASYQKNFGITITGTTEELRAVQAEADVAELLGIAPRTPVLQLRRVAYTFGGRRVEARRSVINTVDYHYRLEEGGTL